VIERANGDGLVRLEVLIHIPPGTSKGPIVGAASAAIEKAVQERGAELLVMIVNGPRSKT